MNRGTDDLRSDGGSDATPPGVDHATGATAAERDGRFDIDRLARRVAWLLVARPRTVVVAFLVVTVLLAPGLALLDTEAGTDQFVDDVPEADALDRVNQEFEPAFDEDDPTTQLIQTGGNVLSQESLLAMLETQQRLEERESLRVADTASPARDVAAELEGEPQTLEAQHRAVEGATDAELADAVRAAAETPGFERTLGEDFSAEDARASAALGSVTHQLPDDDLQDAQAEAASVTDRTDADIEVFGAGVIEAEFETVIVDSLVIVVPVAAVTILGLLLLAYRDPFDFLLGTAALAMTVIWTFGFTGLVGIPFNQMLIAVPVLLLAIGIDFGIHAINRYREERVAGADAETAMTAGISQLLVAFGIIAVTTVIGFGANLVSELGPIREFGVVAAVGMTFTLLVFGVFLPAAKVWLDRLRDRRGLPAFGTTPLGADDSVLGRVLPALSRPARRLPVVFLVVVLLLTAGAAGYGAGVDTTFDDRDFLPPAEPPGYAQVLPGPMQPEEYTATATIETLEENFETAEDDTVTMYVETRLTEDHALTALARAERTPPTTFVEGDEGAEADSILGVIDRYAAEDDEFAALVAASDRSGDGIPDRNLGLIYDELFDSEFADLADEYLTDDRRSTRVIFEVESDPPSEAIRADADDLAGDYRGEATPTGDIVVFQAVADVIFESALSSLAAALALAGVFVVVLYRLLCRSATLGVVTVFPVLVAVCLLAALMRGLGIAFNALTATILAITIGLGVDYTVHVSHRFYDEYVGGASAEAAIETTMQGTGGALTGTVLTTALGIGALTLAVTDILAQFGLLTALSIVLAYLTSVVVLPPALVAWARYLAPRESDGARGPEHEPPADDG